MTAPTVGKLPPPPVVIVVVRNVGLGVTSTVMNVVGLSDDERDAFVPSVEVEVEVGAGAMGGVGAMGD